VKYSISASHKQQQPTFLRKSSDDLKLFNEVAQTIDAAVPVFSLSPLSWSIFAHSNITREWHQDASSNVRNALVYNLTVTEHSIFNPQSLHNASSVWSKARKMELEAFQIANSLIDYYRLIAVQLSKIVKAKRLSAARENLFQFCRAKLNQ